MSLVDLVLFSTGSTIFCTLLAGEVALIINDRKLHQLRRQSNGPQRTVNAATNKLINLIGQIGTDEDLVNLVNQCRILKDPNISTKDTREVTTSILTRLFTKACDDELRHNIIETIVDLEMADESKQISLKRLEDEQTKEKNNFLKLIESINQRLGGIK